jgi:hypothetical protein
MKNWAKKHILLRKIRVKRKKKNRSRPLKDKKGHLKFEPSFKGHIKKEDAATPLNIRRLQTSAGKGIFL